MPSSRSAFLRFVDWPAGAPEGAGKGTPAGAGYGEEPLVVRSEGTETSDEEKGHPQEGIALVARKLQSAADRAVLLACLAQPGQSSRLVPGRAAAVW